MTDYPYLTGALEAWKRHDLSTYVLLLEEMESRSEGFKQWMEAFFQSAYETEHELQGMRELIQQGGCQN